MALSHNKRSFSRDQSSWRVFGTTALMSVCLLLVTLNVRAEQTSHLQVLLSQPDHVLVLRHALAPGVGDPQGFSLDDCASQRNLSEQGRLQAIALGDSLRSLGVSSAQVYSSLWCRSWQTAELLGMGPVEHLSALDSFFHADYRDQQQARMDAWLEHLQQTPSDKLRVYVTHQVNITALTDAFPGSGKGFLLRIKPGEKPQIVSVFPPD
ncbi:histidine phosphatase family protein [Methylophaga lonarensis]|uniref:histidine phosphatase family protein n=1 Tax=Methylophaga lonarensis TaxID=999151 RepID=UPI003D2D592F